jgi:sec-independent protein translocase protein TatB
MFEFDAGKLLIIGIVALIVIGPKELPRVMRQVGQMVGKMRRLAGEFQSQFNAAMREAEFAELKAEAAKLADETKIDVGFNPMTEMKAGLTEALEAPIDAKPAEPDKAGSNGAAPHPYLTPLSASESVATPPAPQEAPAAPDEHPSIRAALEPVSPVPSEQPVPEHVRTSA